MNSVKSWIVRNAHLGGPETRLRVPLPAFSTIRRDRRAKLARKVIITCIRKKTRREARELGAIPMATQS